jgi:hypothetical protein
MGGIRTLQDRHLPPNGSLSAVRCLDAVGRVAPYHRNGPMSHQQKACKGHALKSSIPIEPSKTDEAPTAGRCGRRVGNRLSALVERRKHLVLEQAQA